MDTLISMLPGGREIRELYIEKQNLLSFLKPGALIIDCTTADPETCREIHKEAEKNPSAWYLPRFPAVSPARRREL